MKSKTDPRHQLRVKRFRLLFAWQTGANTKLPPEISKIISRLTDIDNHITQLAPKWPLDKINRIDLAILRCAIWELLCRNQTPHKVVIDEAVEVAKEFGNDSSSSFVNGVLGSFVKSVLQKHDP